MRNKDTIIEWQNYTIGIIRDERGTSLALVDDDYGWVPIEEYTEISNIHLDNNHVVDIIERTERLMVNVIRRWNRTKK